MDEHSLMNLGLIPKPKKYHAGPGRPKGSYKFTCPIGVWNKGMRHLKMLRELRSDLIKETVENLDLIQYIESLAKNKVVE